MPTGRKYQPIRVWPTDCQLENSPERTPLISYGTEIIRYLRWILWEIRDSQTRNFDFRAYIYRLA